MRAVLAVQELHLALQLSQLQLLVVELLELLIKSLVLGRGRVAPRPQRVGRGLLPHQLERQRPLVGVERLGRLRAIVGQRFEDVLGQLALLLDLDQQRMLIGVARSQLAFLQLQLVELLAHVVLGLVGKADNAVGDQLRIEACDLVGEVSDLGLRELQIPLAGEQFQLDVADLLFENLSFAVAGGQLVLVLAIAQLGLGGGELLVEQLRLLGEEG